MLLVGGGCSRLLYSFSFVRVLLVCWCWLFRFRWNLLFALELQSNFTQLSIDFIDCILPTEMMQRLYAEWNGVCVLHIRLIDERWVLTEPGVYTNAMALCYLQ